MAVRRRALIGVPVLAACAALLLAVPAFASLSFTNPVKLPPTAGSVTFSGGEPSLAFDPTGSGDVYVTAPEAVPAVVNAPFGGPANGVGFWASRNGGVSWNAPKAVGSATGGGDSDVAVGTDHTVYVADLEATAAAICISKNRAKTFPDCANGFAANQEGPENDRQWLTPGTNATTMYLTYHDFTAGFPIIEKSTDGAQTFQPCGSIIDPAGPAAQTYTPQGGTLVSKPIVAKDGTIFVEFATPDQTAPPVGAKLNHMYMAVSPKGGCSATSTFKNYVIYTDPGADLAKIFQVTAMDGAGNLYVAAAGTTKAGQKNTNLWLFTSSNRGQKWSNPVQVNQTALKANVLPGITAGKTAGQVAIGWFGTTTNGDPNNLTNQWRYYAAESFNGGKSFSRATVTPSVIHYGDVCTQGVFCGLIPGQPENRNLLDFSSLTVNPATGCVGIALPGDPYNRPDKPNGPNSFESKAYFSRQNGGQCFPRTAAP
jgi:hypothetical protein